MSIKQHFQTAMQGIIAEKDRAVSAERDRVMREQVAPKVAEIEQSKTEAINALTTKLNQDIAALQQAFNAERTRYVEASEKKKAEYTEQAIATATAVITVEYDKAIANLEKQISEIKE
jgi:exonuclease VII large subunit